MRLNLFCILCFSGLLVLSSSCVETVKENSLQVVHVYTDLPKSLDSTLFKEFEKQSSIQVFIHFATAESILAQLKTEKWQFKADLVLLKNALNLNDLSDEKILQVANNTDDKLTWQPLFINPFVFYFPKDTVPIFTSYGQLIRNKNARVDPHFLDSFEQWGNLIPTLKKNYPLYSLSEIQNKILYSDSLKGKEIKQLQIATYSHFSDSSQLTFPDQFYKGSIGIIGGIGIIKQSRNRSNALELYEYCQKLAWRKKLAQDLSLFPILDTESNKKRAILFFQEPPNLKDIKNSAEK